MTEPEINPAGDRLPAKKNNVLRKKNDMIFKGAFEDYFIHLLRFIYPNADELFDMGKEILFMNKELAEIAIDPQQPGGTRHADLLARVTLTDGMAKWFLLHIEIQGVADAGFPERVFEYWVWLRDKYRHSVVSLAVFTGTQNQLRPDGYNFRMLGTELNFRFRTYQIFDHTQEELLRMNNPFALVVAVAQQEVLSEKASDYKKQVARSRIMDSLAVNCKFDAGEIRKFVLFLNRIIIVKNRRYNHIFDRQVQKLTGGTVTMGIIEALKILDREEGIEIGIEKGIEKGRHEEALEIAREMKKDQFPVDKIIKITKLTIQEIEALDQ